MEGAGAESSVLNVFPQNSYVEILAPKVIVLGDEAVGRRLDHEGRDFINGISTLIKETRQRPLPSACEEDTMRRWASLNQEAGSIQTLNLLAPLSWTSQP